MKRVRIIFIGFILGVVSVAHADIASVQYVQSIIQSLDPANDATLTIQKNGTNVGTFTANSSSNTTVNITMTASDVGLSNVQNVDQTNASNITSGTVGYARLPVGSATSTVAAGDDVRFNTVSTSQPSGTPPTGQVFIWFDTSSLTP